MVFRVKCILIVLLRFYSIGFVCMYLTGIYKMMHNFDTDDVLDLWHFELFVKEKKKSLSTWTSSVMVELVR